MKRLMACLLLTVLALAGCETVRGFGKDMQKAGRWMEKESSR